MSKPQKSIILDPNIWLFRDYSDYLQAVQDGDFESAFIILKPIIVSWPYPVSLDQDRPDLDPKLPYEALSEILSAVNTTFEQFRKGIDIADCDVNLKNWSMSSFYAFTEALKTGDIESVEALLKQVAVPKDEEYDPMLPLTYQHGVLMQEAVEAQQKVLFRARKRR